MTFSYLSPNIYTDNVKTEHFGIHQWHKISSESLKGPSCRYCIAFEMSCTL